MSPSRPRGPGWSQRTGDCITRSTTSRTGPVMILYGNDKQERPYFAHHKAAAGTASAPSPLPARRRSSHFRFGGRAGPALWEGGVPVRFRRPARALYICRAAPGGGPDPHGVRPGSGGRSGAPWCGDIRPGTRRPGGNIGHKCGAFVPRRAELNEPGGRSRGRCGQHGGGCVGGQR
jgi:hypothetical protein